MTTPSSDGSRRDEPSRSQPPAPATAPGRREQRGRRLRQLVDEWRPSAITLGAPVFPLAVLFGLNAVDELDRMAFAVLLPDIRTHFGLTDSAALALVAATTIAIVLIECRSPSTPTGGTG